MYLSGIHSPTPTDDSILLHLQNMEHSMNDWGEENSCYAKEGYPAVQCIKGREQLRAIASHLRHGTHPRKDHARHMKAVDPIQSTEKVIAWRSNAERYSHQRDGKQIVASDPDEKV